MSLFSLRRRPRPAHAHARAADAPAPAPAPETGAGAANGAAPANGSQFPGRPPWETAEQAAVREDTMTDLRAVPAGGAVPVSAASPDPAQEDAARRIMAAHDAARPAQGWDGRDERLLAQVADGLRNVPDQAAPDRAPVPVTILRADGTDGGSKEILTGWPRYAGIRVAETGQGVACLRVGCGEDVQLHLENADRPWWGQLALEAVRALVDGTRGADRCRMLDEHIGRLIRMRDAQVHGGFRPAPAAVAPAPGPEPLPVTPQPEAAEPAPPVQPVAAEATEAIETARGVLLRAGDPAVVCMAGVNPAFFDALSALEDALWQYEQTLAGAEPGWDAWHDALAQVSALALTKASRLTSIVRALCGDSAAGLVAGMPEVPGETVPADGGSL